MSSSISEEHASEFDESSDSYDSDGSSESCISSEISSDEDKFTPAGYSLLHEGMSQDNASDTYNDASISSDKSERNHSEATSFDDMSDSYEGLDEFFNEYYQVKCLIYYRKKAFTVTLTASALIVKKEDTDESINLLEDFLQKPKKAYQFLFTESIEEVKKNPIEDNLYKFYLSADGRSFYIGPDINQTVYQGTYKFSKKTEQYAKSQLENEAFRENKHKQIYKNAHIKEKELLTAVFNGYSNNDNFDLFNLLKLGVSNVFSPIFIHFKSELKQLDKSSAKELSKLFLKKLFNDYLQLFNDIEEHLDNKNRYFPLVNWIIIFNIFINENILYIDEMTLSRLKDIQANLETSKKKVKTSIQNIEALFSSLLTIQENYFFLLENRQHSDLEKEQIDELYNHQLINLFYQIRDNLYALAKIPCDVIEYIKEDESDEETMSLSTSPYLAENDEEILRDIYSFELPKMILQQFFRQVEQSVDSSVVRIH